MKLIFIYFVSAINLHLPILQAKAHKVDLGKQQIMLSNPSPVSLSGLSIKDANITFADIAININERNKFDCTLKCCYLKLKTI